MIYGYEQAQVNQYGPKQMREVSVATSAAALRSLSQFLLEAADESEAANSDNWHRHIPPELCEQLGCDFVALRPHAEPDSS